DAYEKKLIQVMKIHTDDNVVDLLTKAFDVSRSKMQFGLDLRVLNGTDKLVLPGKVNAARQINNKKKIHATVDSKAVVVTEASIRSSLLLNDADGTTCLSNEAIFQNLALMGYEGELNKLTFQKALFSPQWKYLIHTILHCLSSKSTSWNEFSTNIASAVICLATNQKFNFSKLVFDGMLRNLDTSKHDTTQDSRDSLEGTNRSEGDQVLALEDSKMLSMKRRLGRKESVSKQRRKNAKPEPEPTLDAFDDLDVDGRDYMETEDVVKERRQSNETEELNNGSGKSVLEEPEPAKKMTRSDFDAAQIARDAEIARQLQVDLQAEGIDDAYCYCKLLLGKERYKIEREQSSLAETICSSRNSELHKDLLRLELKAVIEKSKGMYEDLKMFVHAFVPIRRLKMKAIKKSKRQKTDSDLKEEEQLKAFLMIVHDEEGIIDYEVLEKRFLIINWESKFYEFDRHGASCIYYRSLGSDGCSSWDLYEKYGLSLILEDGTEIHMLAERKYPLTKDTLERMLSLRLVVGIASEDAYTLLRFIQKQIDEHGIHDGGEKDL
ncbi:hypothetical protein Tco_0933931, partial [Tanacetum coccineum]